MAQAKADVLQRQATYSGAGISVRSLEETIHTERGRQNVQVDQLKTLRAKNVELQEALTDEVKKLRKLSDYVSRGKLGGSFWSNFKEILSYIPGVNKLAITKRSVEELLRQQYEISSLRVKEAAEFADKLEAAQADLYDEQRRLNEKIIEAARNEEVAAEYVLQVKDYQAQLQAELAAVAEETAATRQTRAQLDEATRTLAQHSTQLQLYHTAEDRLARLKDSTAKLVETIGNLKSDILQYVMAASEKLDLVSGQIRAIGTAADASVVMLEMKKSLDVMTESMNQTTRFVSETQLYFRDNLDRLIDELEIYDDQTRAVLDKNLAISRDKDEQRIAAAVKVALERKAKRQASAGD
jgi:hypothetical protein